MSNKMAITSINQILKNKKSEEETSINTTIRLRYRYKTLSRVFGKTFRLNVPQWKEFDMIKLIVSHNMLLKCGRGVAVTVPMINNVGTV